MINKAVFSYICNEERSPSGYNSFEDMCACLSLASNVAKKHFKKMELITNSYAASIFIDKLQLPFTTVKTEFDNWKHLPQIFWGFGKVKSYQMQDEPFCHIDGDVFMWDKLPNDMLDAKLIFQSCETPFISGYGWYVPLLSLADRLPVYPQIIKDNPVKMAFNCGICGANDLEIIQDWYKASSHYVLGEQNWPIIQRSSMAIHQNLLHEQYFISSICKSKGYLPNKEVRFLLNTNTILEDCYRPERKFTHLWGTTKKDVKNMNKVWARLHTDYPETYELLKKL